MSRDTLKALRKDNNKLKEQLETLLNDFARLEQSVNTQQSTDLLNNNGGEHSSSLPNQGAAATAQNQENDCPKLFEA